MDTVVSLERVTKIFRQKQPSERWRDTLRNLLRPPVREVYALREVDLNIRRGEIVAYAGPNGAGKSTTVKLLSGLLAPTTGTVRALGMDPVRDRIRYVGRIGVVYGQRTELWWDQPVIATFHWKRVVWDIPERRYREMLAYVKEALELGEFMNALARELSLGQRMRADLALALIHAPEILFLDEPTIGLDVLARRSLLQIIKDLNRERSITVMVTSHDMSELEQLAARVILVDRGRIAYDGDWDRLRREYADLRRLRIETPGPESPQLAGAELVSSEAGRHEYRFDAGRIPITQLLQEAARQTEILDVETHRAEIDDVIADTYRRWLGDSAKQ